LAEFTGERLIPGQVGVDLLNEHLARYAFAARLACGKRVLDAGCGAGYGSAELAAAAAISVLGADVADEAINFARESYRLPNLSFEQASCSALPHPDASFDLVVAFEVIEHLHEWRPFLLEVRRVLAPNGQFIVSTPNRLYYNESRGTEGANPFHVHEFDFQEFQEELAAVFPNVSMFFENHVEGVTFQPYQPGNTVEARVDAAEPIPEETHFFVAVCAHRPQIGSPTYVYIPRAGNVLRERGRHITLLEEELATKNQWLERAIREHEELVAAHRAQTAELEGSNQWAQSLNRDLDEHRARVNGLQQELAAQQEDANRMAEGYAAKVKDLEADIRSKVQWAVDLETRLTAEIDDRTQELARAVDALHATEKELEERTVWALRLDEEKARLEREKQHLEAQLEMVRASRWIRLGRTVGLGPDLPAR
jgi:2-polyprenyl-3-methyl-5-hydroxy-6-metoxy-1,4-benzoquinol methylase